MIPDTQQLVSVAAASIDDLLESRYAAFTAVVLHLYLPHQLICLHFRAYVKPKLIQVANVVVLQGGNCPETAQHVCWAAAACGESGDGGDVMIAPCCHSLVPHIMYTGINPDNADLQISANALIIATVYQ